MLTRREFLKITGVTTGSVISNQLNALSLPYKGNAKYFALHSFIENKPDAVFIMRTNVDVKTNSEAIKGAAQKFGQSVFQLTEDSETGIPLSHFFNIKANFTGWLWSAPLGVDFEKVMGIITDVNFVEGIVESFKELGVNSEQLYICDANGSENYTYAGCQAMAVRTGINIQLSKSDPKIQWTNLPDGVWFNRIPYLWPINAPNSCLFNIAKFKAHGMGLTLCAKNLQGTIASPYVQHCTPWGAPMGMDPEHIQSNAFNNISENYLHHREEGIPRWGLEGSAHTGGLGMETGIARCLDNNSVLKPELNVIEGIYGRNGNGFYQGPLEGAGQDFMTNIIIFGKNALYVDIIGHWLGGHEPGNFGLFHIAKERGFINAINPNDIPLYDWNENGSAIRTSLDNFNRTSLVSPYLRKPDEDAWHLCNEPYDYKSSSSGIDPDKPKNIILQQNYPNPFNDSTSIEFFLPKAGKARLEIFNNMGETIEIIADGYFEEGSHLVVWKHNNLIDGTYFYSLRFNGNYEMKKMILLR